MLKQTQKRADESIVNIAATLSTALTPEHDPCAPAATSRRDLFVQIAKATVLISIAMMTFGILANSADATTATQTTATYLA